jgi:hypothetical protein
LTSFFDFLEITWSDKGISNDKIQKIIYLETALEFNRCNFFYHSTNNRWDIKSCSYEIMLNMIVSMSTIWHVWVASMDWKLYKLQCCIFRMQLIINSHSNAERNIVCDWLRLPYTIFNVTFWWCVITNIWILLSHTNHNTSIMWSTSDWWKHCT